MTMTTKRPRCLYGGTVDGTYEAAKVLRRLREAATLAIQSYESGTDAQMIGYVDEQRGNLAALDVALAALDEQARGGHDAPR